MVDVIFLIGGAFAILGIVPLGRGFRLLAKRVAPTRPHAPTAAGGGPPTAVGSEPLAHRSAVDDTHEADLIGNRAAR
jgi:hypothetical protein